LSPSYPNIVVGIWLYLIMILLVITMMMQKAGSSMMITLMLGGAIMCALIEKIQGFEKSNQIFLAFGMCMLMTVFPLVVVGMTRSPKSRLPAGAAVLFSVIYLLFFWISHSF
jgi:hypothetical protein